MERLKFLSPDRKTFLKFEGMGPIGNETRERAFALADAEFSPRAIDAGDGFLAYEAIGGRSLSKEAVSISILERIAQYCAYRASQFPAHWTDSSELRRMLEFNIQQEFGHELKLTADDLITPSPVLVDGRMQPHEWIATASGELLKTDAISHGDNHFFPGPCDIAWDLAGVAVEWRLEPNALEFLMDRFRQISGVAASLQIGLYSLAYCTFRLGFCKMGMSTVRGSAEEGRLERTYRYYRRCAEHLLRSQNFSSAAA
jgi:hypothetical protein